MAFAGVFCRPCTMKWSFSYSLTCSFLRKSTPKYYWYAWLPTELISHRSGPSNGKVVSALFFVSNLGGRLSSLRTNLSIWQIFHSFCTFSLLQTFSFLLINAAFSLSSHRILHWLTGNNNGRKNRTTQQWWEYPRWTIVWLEFWHSLPFYDWISLSLNTGTTDQAWSCGTLYHDTNN